MPPPTICTSQSVPECRRGPSMIQLLLGLKSEVGSRKLTGKPVSLLASDLRSPTSDLMHCETMLGRGSAGTREPSGRRPERRGIGPTCRARNPESGASPPCFRISKPPNLRKNLCRDGGL
jgi:hypothetical protein